jgi:hypothetical protein
VPHRPYCPHHEACPECTYTLLELGAGRSRAGQAAHPMDRRSGRSNVHTAVRTNGQVGASSQPTERGRASRAKLARVEQRSTRSAELAIGGTVAVARVR